MRWAWPVWASLVTRLERDHVTTLYRHSIEDDRRDAELMRVATQVARFGRSALELHGIACRGWDLGLPRDLQCDADGAYSP